MARIPCILFYYFLFLKCPPFLLHLEKCNLLWMVPQNNLPSENSFTTHNSDRVNHSLVCWSWLYVGICVCSVASVVSDSLWPHGPHPAKLSSMGSFWQEYWGRLSCPLPGYLSNPGIKPISPVSPVLQVDSLPLSHLGKPSVGTSSVTYVTYLACTICLCLSPSIHLFIHLSQLSWFMNFYFLRNQDWHMIIT